MCHVQSSLPSTYLPEMLISQPELLQFTEGTTRETVTLQGA